MTDLHALIHRMADELDHNRQCLLDDRRVTHPLADKARAVLARWGNHSAPQPIPVSERLPGPEDCDAEGRCWLGGEQFAPGDPTWILGFAVWAKRFPEIHRYWLPAHALPVPEEVA